MSTTTTDPIADMLTRIRNAIGVRKHEVSLPHSNLKEAVARSLQANGFIDSVSVTDLNVGRRLNIVICAEDASARITEIKRLSKPGRRTYSSAQEMPIVKRGRGVVIVSTSKGLMTGTEAKKAGLGGELIASVY
ncbi:MAG TPA: 30S ribosomal protein S8 [Candidatus Saccharimonadales bacterium]|nr:30S ribosomal protein S8 [Candidatus Saccharimonadales bacterium]